MVRATWSPWTYPLPRIRLLLPNQLNPPEILKGNCSCPDNPFGTGALRVSLRLNTGSTLSAMTSQDLHPVTSFCPSFWSGCLSSGVEPKQHQNYYTFGSHRYMTEAEMIRKVGEEIYQQYTVVNSEFKREEDLVSVGTTAEGVDITVSKVALDADIKIGIGNIMPHPAMGWSGGAKIVFPGVASEETVKNFHIYQGLSDENLYGLDECFIRHQGGAGRN